MSGTTARGALPGTVYLVGGGPGDPDLLTVRARRLLDAADVVVHDRLGPVSMLAELDADLVDVGKSPWHHAVPQQRIHEILIEQARRGRIVVRLKGGDPFVLGRGGEEVLACHAAGVPCEVVPGVSSAVAAPTAAGIPVTHRGVASGVLTISGHDELDPSLLATWPHTIVILMGMSRLDELVGGLLAAGKDPATPTAVVQQAWTADQRAVRAPLHALPAVSRAARLHNPAVIVIGEVADVLPPVGATRVHHRLAEAV